MNPKTLQGLTLALGLTAVGTVYAAQSSDTTIAGWTPFVTMWGSGNSDTAVKALRRITTAFEAFLHRTEIDKPTQSFIDKSWKELEDFDLEGLYWLPAGRSWRTS